MAWARKVVLSVAQIKWVAAWVNRYGMKLGASRFVAGTSLPAAMEVIKEINADGRVATLDHVGEGISDPALAAAAADEVLAVLEAIDQQKAKANVSIKLTQLGLDIDPQLARDHVERIVIRAKELGNFIRIDMEDFERLPATLAIVDYMVERYGPDTVGTVIQSYLRRAGQDVAELGKKKVRLRIVKGAYKESPKVAFPRKQDVDENYERLVQAHLLAGVHVGIATHDPMLIHRLQLWIHQNNIPSHLYEFQMLYGIAVQLQKELIQAGYQVRVYLPYGKDWYDYFTRRIAERPANAWFVIRSMFRS